MIAVVVVVVAVVAIVHEQLTSVRRHGFVNGSIIDLIDHCCKWAEQKSVHVSAQPESKSQCLSIYPTFILGLNLTQLESPRK